MNAIFAEKKYRKSSKEHVAEVLRRQIMTNTFKPGEKLPTTKELVKLAGVSSHTVRQAMLLLENEGLVSSTQGRGTFVIGSEIQASGSVDVPKEKSIKTIAIMGVFSLDKDLPGRYQDETAAGFMEESQRLGLSSHIFAPQIREMETEDIIEAINEIKADGIIWPAPVEDEWCKIEALRDNGYHIVATQRADSESWLPAVAGDYQNAGVEVGRLFIKNNCNKIVIFSYSAGSGHLPITMASGVPNGLLSGALNAYAINGKISNELFTVYYNKGYTAEVSDSIFDILSEIDPACGLIFANTFHFGNLLTDKKGAATELLKNRHVVVISNPGNIQHLMPLISELDISFLVDPFVQVARFAVQKLYSQINGTLSDVKSLLKVELKRAKDWNKPASFGRWSS
jgi:DNA-binding transcriptional regulator YhcF (GntR family)